MAALQNLVLKMVFSSLPVDPALNTRNTDREDTQDVGYFTQARGYFTQGPVQCHV